MSDKTKTKREKRGPSDAEIYATADVITAAYQRQMDPNVSIHTARFPGRAHISLSIDGLGSSSSFLDIDGDGVYLHGVGRYSKLISKSIRNVVKVITESQPAFDQIVTDLRRGLLARKADTVMDEITETLYAIRGVPYDHDVGLPYVVERKAGKTRITVIIPNEKIVEHRELVLGWLGAAVDMVGYPIVAPAPAPEAAAPDEEGAS